MAVSGARSSCDTDATTLSRASNAVRSAVTSREMTTVPASAPCVSRSRRAVTLSARRVVSGAPNHTIWLSKTPGKPGSKSWDSSLPRIATLAWLKEKQGGQRWLIVNTHFDHRGAVARRESAALIARHIKKVTAQDQVPVVVMGDLNCLPDSDPYKNLQQGELKDALLHSRMKHQGPMSSWNGFGKSVVPGRRIDFIFVGPRVTVLEHKIDARQFKGRFPSDHCPVITRIAQP